MLGLGLGLTSQRRRAAAWTPASLAGTPREWLASPAYCFADTAGTVSCGDTDPVAAWRDRITGMLLTQTDPLKRPTLRLASGTWRVRFDGVNDCVLNSDSLSGSQPVTFGFRANSVPGAVYIGNVFDGGPWSPYHQATRLASGVSTPTGWRLFAGFDTVSGGTYAAGWTTGAGLASGAASVLRIGGTQVGTGNPGLGSLSRGIIIGNDSRDFNQPFNGDVVSVVVTGADASAQFAALESYLTGLAS